MKGLITVGTAIFTAIHVIAGLIYSALIPMLDRHGVLSWSFFETSFWLEVVIHTVITAILGVLFCRWFALRVEKKIKAESVFE
ncbi:hypothetical protein [Citromicrobium sp. JLT1363]|mgnify:CR=1 FL=1|uniref:hypothetical protein n=1 Tax=Citromicrobium sp. JLT1363 TaxID=517722 RepID=UPI000225ED6F|nr:hypothetical protein [Citromicrobium sp. JLT1363]